MSDHNVFMPARRLGKTSQLARTVATALDAGATVYSLSHDEAGKARWEKVVDVPGLRSGII